ncbi:unnamed protein product [Cochlearia groenlandica]
MGNENVVSRPFTRALASALRASEVTFVTQNQQRENMKRPALEDMKAPSPKKMKKTQAVLRDITNAAESEVLLFQDKNIKQIKKGSGLVSTSVTLEVTDLQFNTDAKTEVVSVPDIPKFIDIDSNYKDPLLCCLYAPEIYYNLRVSELKRRPVPCFIRRVQKDVTESMRGILVDWLVEVSEEYALVPDTLYLTVYLIDYFLHGNYVPRQQLQLLGITCMFIASKYEEICAPRIEELCLITDNTYTRDQVLEMENQVLKHFSFQIYTPTSKTFLRRFLRAAQASYQRPSLEIEFLASYLTELTLIDYNFLKFLPSIVAASAVFLAKWTLDQTKHPWNPTLEHYTTYKASELKASVIALQELQLNNNGCSLNVIRIKYKQEKFKSVAVLRSPKLRDTLF